MDDSSIFISRSPFFCHLRAALSKSYPSFPPLLTSFGKKVVPTALSNESRGTMNLVSGLSGGMYALGITKLPIECSFLPPALALVVRTILKKWVGTAVSSGALPSRSYLISHSLAVSLSPAPSPRASFG